MTVLKYNVFIWFVTEIYKDTELYSAQEQIYRSELWIYTELSNWNVYRSQN